MKKYCCNKFRKQATSHQSYMGSGLGYPGMNPATQFQIMGKAWVVNGCCGGGCHIIERMKHCPYCGTKL